MRKNFTMKRPYCYQKLFEIKIDSAVVDICDGIGFDDGELMVMSIKLCKLI